MKAAPRWRSLRVIAALPPVADAIAKNDRDGLGKLLGEALESLKAQGIPADLVLASARDFDLPRPCAKGVRRRCFGAAYHRGGSDQDRQVHRRRRARSRGARDLRHDADHARRQDAGQCRRRRRLRQGIRRSRQEALRHRPCGLFVRRQGLQEAVLDLRRRSGRDLRRAEGRVRRPALAPRRHDRRPARRALSRADQELRRPAGRHSRNHQGYDRVRGGSGEFAAQPDPRHGRHPGRRDRAGVPARSRPVAPIGRDHRGHEPPFRRRDRRHDPRQRAPRRTRHHGRARSTCSAAA